MIPEVRGLAPDRGAFDPRFLSYNLDNGSSRSRIGKACAMGKGCLMDWHTSTRVDSRGGSLDAV